MTTEPSSDLTKSLPSGQLDAGPSEDASTAAKQDEACVAREEFEALARRSREHFLRAGISFTTDEVLATLRRKTVRRRAQLERRSGDQPGSRGRQLTTK